MITFHRRQLANGLQVLVYPDHSTPMVALNVCYHVGSKNEDPEKTGFAHLFEHLMFGGSLNIPDYDLPLQQAGGENNAFTTNDITNYYLTLPRANLELAFWLESDRMLGLDFSEESLEVQRNVVTEEFKQCALNQPYGDVWHILRDMAYKVHPYRWPTIGRDISHIAHATLDEVKTFFDSFYRPGNAVLVLSGNVEEEECFRLAEKWFEPIPSGIVRKLPVPAEPPQREFRQTTVERDVPDHALYMAFHMDDRRSRSYYVADLISDILAGGNSSRLYRKLVKEKRMFAELDASISGDSDPGLLLIAGKMARGVSVEKGADALRQELKLLSREPVAPLEMEKVKNKLEADLILGRMNYLNVAQELASLENVSRAEKINEMQDIYFSVTAEEIMETSRKMFQDENCSQLNYLARS